MSDTIAEEELTQPVFEVKTHQEPDGSWWVEAPGIPGLVAQGETYEELVRNLSEAFEGLMLVREPEVAEKLGIRPTPARVELHLELREEVSTFVVFEGGYLRNAA